MKKSILIIMALLSRMSIACELVTINNDLPIKIGVRFGLESVFVQPRQVVELDVYSDQSIEGYDLSGKYPMGRIDVRSCPRNFLTLTECFKQDPETLRYTLKNNHSCKVRTK